MRIVVIADWFSEPMGYAENFLPKALATLGHEVHVVTSNAQVYFRSPSYADTYEPFIGPPIVACGSKQLDGYTLHRLPHGRWPLQPWEGILYIRGLPRKLRELKPEIVQTFSACSPTSWVAALCKPVLRYSLFNASHIHASVWHGKARRRAGLSWLPRLDLARLAGRFISRFSEKCYPISTDAARIVVEDFGVPIRQVEVCSLGVDDQLFRPPIGAAELAARKALRESLGFAEQEIVCIYTGRLAPGKGPEVLARAIDELVGEGLPFRGLFVGLGSPSDVARIRDCRGCVIRPFVPAQKLPPFYWAADIGVWPKQESTSQLDAMACGLPLVLSNRVEVLERVEGNGLLYEEGDHHDLARQIRLLADPQLRAQYSAVARRKVLEQFSWTGIAARRVQAYATSRAPRAAVAG